jgi:hypothetical protein
MKMRRGVVMVMAVGLLLLLAGLVWRSGLVRPRLHMEPQPHAVLRDLGLADAERPMLAVAENGAVYLLAVDRADRRLKMAMSHDDGQRFLHPVAVSPEGAPVNARGENGPSLAVRGRNVYALWQQNRAGGGADVYFARQTGMGMPFAPPVRVSGKPAGDTSFTGFSALGVSPRGEIFAVWLDGRDPPSPEGTFSVYVARSSDQGATFSKDLRIAGGVCPCCRPALAFGESGEVYVSWRQVFDGDIRDMVVATSRDGGQSFEPPVRVAADDWVLHACPDIGPGLAVSGSRLYAAWYTAGRGGPGIRLAYSDDHGRSFHPPVIASQGIEGATHPMLATGLDGSVLLVFQGRGPAPAGGLGTDTAYVALVQGDAGIRPVAVPAGGTIVSYPVAAMGTQPFYVAWTDHQESASTVHLVRGMKR